jgi:hypothetical protein
VNGFLSASLFFFAGCAVLGMLPAMVLAARARQPVMAVVTLVIAAYVVYVLVAAGLALHRH